MKSSKKIIDHLYRLTTLGIKYNLDRMFAALENCGNPHNKLRIIHVAGTNGKGSTCAFFESMLRRYGYSTGLFTSPHLLSFEERFMINGYPIQTNQWVEVYRDLESVIDSMKLSFFEASTLIAFSLFSRYKLEWVVLEVGMGGRLDATNVVIPQLAVCSAIGIDHVEFLGRNISEIASEKLGIMKKGVPFIIIEPDPSLLALIEEKRLAVGPATCTIVRHAEAEGIVYDESCTSFYYKGVRFSTKLCGNHQVANALLAIRGMEQLGFTDLSLLAEGIASTFIAGRFQKCNINGKIIIFDVAHNPSAAYCLANTIKIIYPNKKITFVIGIMKDKDIGGILAELAPLASSIFAVKPRTERAQLPQKILDAIPNNFKGTKHATSSVSRGVQQAFQTECDVICITGSFFTVGEAMYKLKVTPYETTTLS